MLPEITSIDGEAVGRQTDITQNKMMKGEAMKSQNVKDERETVGVIVTEEIELDLEELEEVIAPGVGPCYRK